MGELFWWFVFYGVVGFLLEVAFAQAVHSPKPDRKCHLLLPVCPVYGVGALAVLLLPEAVKDSPPLLVACGVLICTVVEWALSWFYEKAAWTAFWDYRALPFNLDGRVCLLFSLFWGFLCLPLMYVLQPWVETWSGSVPAFVTVPAALFYFADAAASLLLLRRGGAAALRWYVRLRPSSSH